MADMALGFESLFSLSTFLYMNVGVLVGLVFGAIPGLTGTIGIILFLPVTYTITPLNALILLLAIFCGGEFGGSISAILIGTPGTNAAAATMLDGYPLAKRGKARKALMMALVASVFGGLFSALVLLFMAPTIAEFTINFGPAEFFTLAVFGLSVISSISGKNPVKGVIAGCLGILVSLIGIDSMTGTPRLTFDRIEMLGGLGLMPVLMGLFAIPGILEIVGKPPGQAAKEGESVAMDDADRLATREWTSCWRTLIRSSVIGTIVGAIPGPGTGLASFLGYDRARRASKTPEKFGTGMLEGIAASESANNAVTAGALIPLFTLGIPGSPSAAVLIGAFMIHGMVPGPALFQEQGVLMWAVMFGMIIINLFVLLQGRYLTRLFALITKVPETALAAILLVLCSAGAYSVNNAMFDIGVFFLFGFLSYAMGKTGFPIMPISLGYVLGPMAEFNLRRALVLSEGSPSIFFTRPISLFFIVVTVVTVCLTLRPQKGKAGRQPGEEA